MTAEDKRTLHKIVAPMVVQHHARALLELFRQEERESALRKLALIELAHRHLAAMRELLASPRDNGPAA